MCASCSGQAWGQMQEGEGGRGEGCVFWKGGLRHRVCGVKGRRCLLVWGGLMCAVRWYRTGVQGGGEGVLCAGEREQGGGEGGAVCWGKRAGGKMGGGCCVQTQECVAVVWLHCG